LTADSELLLTMMLDKHTHKNLVSRSNHLHAYCRKRRLNVMIIVDE